jgi:hypothetical protein
MAKPPASNSARRRCPIASICSDVAGWSVAGPLLDRNFAGGQRRSEYQSARRSVAGGGAVVNQRVAFFGFQELGDVGHADFQFERGSDAVERLDALAGEFLAVLVQIDKAGSDNQAAGMNDAASEECLGRDADYLSVADADVPHGIEAGFGIHDASAFEHKIILLGGDEVG